MHTHECANTEHYGEADGGSRVRQCPTPLSATGIVVTPAASNEPAELTVRQFAAQEKQSERTVRRWLKKGALAFRRTPGGGIRILDRRTAPRCDTCGHALRCDTCGHSMTS